MTKKCGFIGCNNPSKKEFDTCSSCHDRKENNICSACRQKEPNEGKFLTFHQSVFKRKKVYQFVAKLRAKVPVKFQTKIDQILPNLKLSASEEKLVEQAEKIISDYLTEKGGKQDNVFYIKLCSVCNPELGRRLKDFSNQNPQTKIIEKKLSGEEIEPIYKEIKQEIGKERLKEIEEEIEEEIFGKAGEKDIPQPNIPNNNDNNGNGQNQNNNNSSETTRLQQEINKLKTEIDNLKNQPNTDDALRDKERELKEKEKELEELKGKKNPPPLQKQPPKNQNNNSNLPLYIGVSIAIIGVICLIVAVLLAKKKKKTVVYPQIINFFTPQH